MRNMRMHRLNELPNSHSGTGHEPVNQLTAVSNIPPNPAGGRDLVFGDIHGCFGTVEQALEALDYDASKDRLFSLGDLIDYGPRSGEAVDWVNTRFAATVRGNHESMMLNYLQIGARMHEEGGAWYLHWSSKWFPSGWENRRGRAMTGTPEVETRWRTALEGLPFTATVQLAGGARVGLIHSRGPVAPDHDWHWDRLCTRIARDQHSAWAAMWTRAKVRRPSADDPEPPPGVVGIDYACHGHDPGPEPGWSARRMLCLDTGVHVPELGHLTVAELKPGTPKLHRFTRVDTLPEAPRDQNLPWGAAP